MVETAVEMVEAVLVELMIVVMVVVVMAFIVVAFDYIITKCHSLSLVLIPL